MTHTIHRQNKIITRKVYLGGNHEWCAYHDGDKETQHYGFGETEAEAIADLKRLDDEWSESMEEERSA